MAKIKKHDAMMILAGVGIGAVAMWLLAKYQPTLVFLAVPQGRYPGFSVAGTICPSCETLTF
jgi:hypothetical protein